MRIHHLSCGTMCPWGGRLMYGPAGDPLLRRLVCHCLLIETPRAGLVLVDTGFGLDDVHRARQRLSRFFMLTNRIHLDDEQTALRQIEKLGYGALDVRHIVLTHLDFDHAGGIEDFPQATVHVLHSEWTAANHGRRGFIARNRYRPQQWDLGVTWQHHHPGGARWSGFECVRDMAGLPPEILMVPLIGHTWGHCGVAVQQQGSWLLHAGDAYFFRGELDGAHGSCPPGLRAYQAMMEVDRRARLANQQRLRELAAANRGIVDVFCAHDPVELARRQSTGAGEALSGVR